VRAACEKASEDESLRASSESVSDLEIDGSHATASIAIHGSKLDGQVIEVLDRKALAKVLESAAEGTASPREVSCLWRQGRRRLQRRTGVCLVLQESARSTRIRPLLLESDASTTAMKVGASDSEGGGYTFEVPPGFENVSAEERFSAGATNLSALATPAAPRRHVGIVVGVIRTGPASDRTQGTTSLLSWPHARDRGT
jgi:hypothetical protein